MKKASKKTPIKSYTNPGGNIDKSNQIVRKSLQGIEEEMSEDKDKKDLPRTGNKRVGTPAFKYSGSSPAMRKLSASCKAAARRKFDVYPSAYANMWASKQQGKGKC